MTWGNYNISCANKRIDYECELVAIIGKPCKDVSKKDVLSYVYGWTTVNDMSCRDHPSDVGLWVEKNFDSSVPMGECIVNAEI